ncbi:hypothetical protein ACQJBY_002016 [Aegilops geniculata]
MPSSDRTQPRREHYYKAKRSEGNGFCCVQVRGRLGPPRLPCRRGHHRGRQVPGHAVDSRPRHVLRRRGYGRDDGRGVRVRHHGGVRRGHGGAELDAVPGRLRVRDVLPDPVRESHGLLQGLAGDHGDRDEPVPAQLGAGHQQRRLVQPAAHPLRPRHPGLQEDGRLACGHRPRHVPQGAVHAQGRDPVRVPGEPALAAGVRHQRRRRRRRRGDVGEG